MSDATNDRELISRKVKYTINNVPWLDRLSLKIPREGIERFQDLFNQDVNTVHIQCQSSYFPTALQGHLEPPPCRGDGGRLS